MKYKGRDIRKEFPILRSVVYLDSAATAQKPSCVIEAEKEVYETSYANIHRGIYDLSERATEAVERSRADVASFIGARTDEIVFTRNATESINVAARCVRSLLRPGDTILVTAMEHHSNLIPWQEVCRETGAELVFVECTEDGRLDMEDMASKLSDRVRIVAVTSMSNVLGTINPIAEITKHAHSVGALVVVDAAQSVGRVQCSVREWDADIVAFSGHKMYGPSGVGVLYGKYEHLKRFSPVVFGGGMVTRATRERAVWREAPWKFEAGTPDIAGIIALKEAVRFLSSLDMAHIEHHEREMTNMLHAGLTTIPGVTVLGPSPEYRSGIVSWVTGGIHSHDLASFLNEKGIAVRAGHHCAQPLLDTLGISDCTRASVSVFTVPEDIDALLYSLTESKKVFQV